MSCDLCIYKEEKEEEINVWVCTHPKWKDMSSGNDLYRGYMIEIEDGKKLIEIKGSVPDWCPLRISLEDITPDMPPPFV